jgi:hypothetical protein
MWKKTGLLLRQVIHTLDLFQFSKGRYHFAERLFEMMIGGGGHSQAYEALMGNDIIERQITGPLP